MRPCEAKLQRAAELRNRHPQHQRGRVRRGAGNRVPRMAHRWNTRPALDLGILAGAKSGGAGIGPAAGSKGSAQNSAPQGRELRAPKGDVRGSTVGPSLPAASPHDPTESGPDWPWGSWVAAHLAPKREEPPRQRSAGVPYAVGSGPLRPVPCTNPRRPAMLQRRRAVRRIHRGGRSKAGEQCALGLRLLERKALWRARERQGELGGQARRVTPRQAGAAGRGGEAGGGWGSQPGRSTARTTLSRDNPAVKVSRDNPSLRKPPQYITRPGEGCSSLARSCNPTERACTPGGC